ncbi:hypothetical protein PoB_000809500 [Plakobranchus ocellatus]|uniref:Uncharacterized protein n=1 Tax=Plakobranchus ocellatus TaxID=259542 RepID=A0AAV3YEV4_9GAST|nr:hypothetical protein PoB_000809500 [Plakobranchus ocellatus]
MTLDYCPKDTKIFNRSQGPMRLQDSKHNATEGQRHKKQGQAQQTQILSEKKGNHWKMCRNLYKIQRMVTPLIRSKQEKARRPKLLPSSDLLKVQNQNRNQD